MVGTEAATTTMMTIAMATMMKMTTMTMTTTTTTKIDRWSDAFGENSDWCTDGVQPSGT